MSFLKATANDNFNIKFLELRKLKLCENEIEHSVNLVAVSHRHHLIFAAHNNCIKIIKENDLLDFEWNKKVINEVVESFPHSTIAFNFTPFLLTTSGGLNNILVVCGISPNNELKIEFFEVNSLANNNFVSFATLNIPENVARGNKVLSIDWHPEYAESLFVAALTNGMLISVGVNLDSRNAQLLAQYLTNHKITSVCWSPKGKQLVVGKINGSLVQLKHVNGTSFQEAKTIAAPQEFPCKVLSVKWVLSSLFIVAYVDERNQNDPVTKYASVFAPPKKQPVFYDFGPVCLNAPLDGPNQRYSIDFCQIGELVLCLSSMSSEVGIIGADGPETTLPTSWSQFILEDNARIELPLSKSGFESFPRGVAFLRVSPKLFRISETETYGGDNCPLLLILTSSGILCPYYVINKSKPFSLHTPSVSQLPYEITQVSTHHAPSSVIPQSQLSFNTAPVVQEVVVSPVQSIQSNVEISQPQITSEPPVVESPSSEDKELALKASEALKQEMEQSFLIAIKEEINEFGKELKTMREKLAKVLELNVGTDEEKQDIVTLTKESVEFLKEIKELYRNLDLDVLQGFALETYAMLQEATCRVNRDVDSTYKKILSKRALSPKLAQSMKKMEETAKYIEIQLREVNNVLDHEWKERFEKKKPIRDPSEYEIILKLLSNNQKTIAAMKSELNKLESRSPKSHKPTDRNTKEEIKNLVKSMNKTHLDDSIERSDEVSDEEERIVFVKVLPQDKKKKVWEFLEQRSYVPVVKASAPVDVKSSRFVSAVVKAQQTLKSIQEKKESQKIASPVKPQPKPTPQKPQPSPAVPKQSNKLPVSKALTSEVKITPVTPAPVTHSESMSKTTIPFQAIQTTISAVTKPIAVQPSKATVVASPKPVLAKPVTTVTTPIATMKPIENIASEASLSAKPVTPIKDNNGNLKSFPVKTTPLKPIEPFIAAPAPKTPTSSFSFATVEKSNVVTPKAVNLSETVSNFSTPKSTSTPFTTGLGSQQPFKFSLSDNSFPFKPENKVNEENKAEAAPKYEDVTPPTSPDPRKNDPNKTPEKVPLEGIKPVQFSFKMKSQELSGSDQSKDPKPAAFSVTISKTSESSVSSSTDKVKTVQTVFPPQDLSVTATPVSVATTVAAPTSTTIVTPIASKPAEVSQPSATSTSSSFLNATSSVFTPSNQTSSPTSLFGQSTSIQSQTSAFGATTPSTSSSVFVQNPAAVAANKVTSPVSPFSPVSSESQFPSSFNFCNLGGKPNPENVNKNPFGGAFGAAGSTPSLFGSQSSPQPAFGAASADANSGSFTSGSGVAQTGFGGFQQTPSPPKFGGFGAAPAFGSSPSFGGGAVFGGSPSFGGNPVFGSAPAFGSPPAFQQPAQQPSFSSFAAASEIPTFGAIASQQPSFGVLPQQNEPQSFGFSQGFSGFGANPQFSSPQFSQRRQ